jgi:hypothetical protein
MKPKFVYIIALLITLFTLYGLITTENELYAAQQQNAALTQQIETLQQDISTLQGTVDKQEQEIAELTKEKHTEAQKTNRGGERLISLGKWKVTGYCSCSICCGKWAKNRPNGKIYGRDGKTELIPGVSVAADLPFGTKLIIGGRQYIVHDKPAKWVIEKNGGRVVDLYCGSDHGKAWDVGNERAEVWMVE